MSRLTRLGVSSEYNTEKNRYLFRLDRWDLTGSTRAIESQVKDNKLLTG